MPSSSPCWEMLSSGRSGSAGVCESSLSWISSLMTLSAFVLNDGVSAPEVDFETLLVVLGTLLAAVGALLIVLSVLLAAVGVLLTAVGVLLTVVAALLMVLGALVGVVGVSGAGLVSVCPSSCDDAAGLVVGSSGGGLLCSGSGGGEVVVGVLDCSEPDG